MDRYIDRFYSNNKSSEQVLLNDRASSDHRVLIKHIADRDISQISILINNNNELILHTSADTIRLIKRLENALSAMQKETFADVDLGFVTIGVFQTSTYDRVYVKYNTYMTTIEITVNARQLVRFSNEAFTKKLINALVQGYRLQC